MSERRMADGGRCENQLSLRLCFVVAAPFGAILFPFTVRRPPSAVHPCC